MWPTQHFDLHVAWQKIAQDVYLRARALSGNKVLSLPGVCPHSAVLESRIKSENKSLKGPELVAKVKEEAFQQIRDFQEILSRAGVWSEWDHPFDTSSPEAQTYFLKRTTSNKGLAMI